MCQVKWLEKVRIKTFIPLPGLIKKFFCPHQRSMWGSQFPNQGIELTPGLETFLTTGLPQKFRNTDSWSWKASGQRGKARLTCVQGRCQVNVCCWPNTFRVTGEELVIEFPGGQPVSASRTIFSVSGPKEQSSVRNKQGDRNNVWPGQHWS